MKWIVIILGIMTFIASVVNDNAAMETCMKKQSRDTCIHILR